jgi:HlyD family secretion protein
MILQKRLIRILAVVLGVILGFRMTGGDVSNQTDEPVPRAKKQVLVAEVTEQILSPTITLPASIMAAAQVDLVPLVSGEITEINVTEGTEVSEKQTILTVEQDEDSTYQNAVKQAEIALSSSQTSLSGLYASLSEEIQSMGWTIEELEDQLSYARNSENLTSDSGEASLVIYEEQIEAAETAVALSEQTLSNTEDQADLSVSEGRAQALTYAKSSLDSANSAIKHANELLGVDDNDNTFYQRHRDALDNISSHIYLVRADIAFGDADDAYLAADELIDSLSGDDERETIEDGLEEVEEALNYTLILVDHMEALLRLERKPPDDYESVYNTYLATYDADQATIASQLATIQATKEGLEATELGAEISIENAEAGVASAEDNLDSAMASLDSMEAQVAQSESNASLSVNSIQNQLNSAHQSLDVLQTQYNQQIAQAGHQVSLSEVQLEAAKIQSETGVIESPISGMLASFDLQPGEIITAGMPIGTIVNTAYFKVEFSVSEFEIPYLTVGDTMDLQIDAYSDTSFSAWIYYLSPIPDSARTYKVKAYINDIQETPLVSGMSAEVGVSLSEETATVSIPLETISSTSSSDTVFVVEDGVAYERTIEIGDVSDGYAMIISGLVKGETLITQGQNLLNDGDQVTILTK